MGRSTKYGRPVESRVVGDTIDERGGTPSRGRGNVGTSRRQKDDFDFVNFCSLVPPLYPLPILLLHTSQLLYNLQRAPGNWN